VNGLLVVAALARGGLMAELEEAGAAEAPIVVRIDVEGARGLVELVRSRVPSFLRGGFDDQVASIAASLGGDPFTPDGWKQLGLDPKRSIVIAIGRSNASMAGIRAVVPVADPARAAQTIVRAQALAPALRFGAPGRGKTLTIDLVAPTDAGDAGDGSALFTPVPPKKLDALLGPEPIAILIKPQRLAETMQRLRGRDPTELAPVAGILGFPLGDLAATISIRNAILTVHARWEVAPKSALSRALATTIDSGLPRPADTPDAALHVHSYVAPRELAALDPTHMTFDLPSSPYFPAGGLYPLLQIMAWPYSIGATIAHVNSADARAKPIFDGLRDAVLVVQTIGDDLDHTSAAFEIALDRTAFDELRVLITKVWGAAPGLVDHGRIRPFARGTSLGVAIQDSGPAYLAIVRHAPAPPKDLVFEAHAAPAALALLSPLAVFAGALDLSARWDGHAIAIDATLSPP